MTTKRMKAIAVSAALLLPYATALAQQFDLSKLGAVPQAIKIADLTDEYTAVKIAAGTYDLNSAWTYVAYSTFGGSSDDPREGKIARMFDMLWTKGDVVTLDGHRYLVTYRLDVTDAMRTMGEYSSRFERAAPVDPVLRAHLVNLDMVTSISPYMDYKADDLKALFAPLTPQEVPDAQTRGLSNIKQVSLGMIMYTTDYDDITPYAQSTKTVEYLTYPYVKNRDVWKTHNPNGSRFLFNMAVAGVSTTDIEDPAETVLFYESAAWPDGRRIVAYNDGHSRLLTEDEWQVAKKTMALKIKKSAKPLPAAYGAKGVDSRYPGG